MSCCTAALVEKLAAVEKRLAKRGDRAGAKEVASARRQLTRLAEMREAEGWDDLPEGWTEKSARSFWNSVGGTISKCIEKIKSHKEITNPGAFCASLGRKLGVD